jgi:large subunit ribosomal protein L29
MKTTEQLNDLRGLAPADLRQRATEVEDQVFRLRIQRSVGQADAGHKIRPLRRELARIKTVLREKGAQD